MTPRADEHEKDNLSATDDDDDDDFKEDMAAIARACMIAGHHANSDSAAGPNLDVRAGQIPAEDPLLDSGDAIVPVTTDSDDEQDDLECLKRVQSLYQPLSSIPPLPPPLTAKSDDDDVDDFETVRAIMKRFSKYGEGPHEGKTKTLPEEDQTSIPECDGDIAKDSIHYESHGGDLCPVSQDPDEITDWLTENMEVQHFDFDESCQPDAFKSSKLPKNRTSFPPSAHAVVDAIQKNRSLQRFLRSKLIELEAKIEENKQLRNKVKLLKDFQLSCIRRTGHALSLKKDPRVQLISAKKSSAPKNSKSHKKVSAMCCGPEENSRVANYKMVLERFPLSLDRKKWSNVERENLLKGIKQQFQEILLQISVDRISSECSFGDANDLDGIISSVKDLEITPERIREFLPKVNWDRLASMYVVGRTGAECESRWLNCEDPLINQGTWTGEEDRSLLLLVQDMGIRNWFDIAVSLATNRTPFQCLARYQRSLNPSMLNSEWTEEEDAQLCSAVTFFGENDWQSVASVLERRTGTQCSNRWKKSLCPERKGSFTQEENIRLTVAVMLFGRKWNQIAKFVPGRIQSQCRDRYLNSLDPSLKWGGWTEEEDLKLEVAIAKHGYCWSKVAEEVPPRTDSQCRKRWKVICPEQVPLLQEARKKKKSIVANNFVDRESERPALTLDDFLPLHMLAPKSSVGAAPNHWKKRKRKSSNVSKKMRSRKRVKKARHTEEVQDVGVHSDDQVKNCSEEVPGFASKVPEKMRSKKHAKRTQIHPNEVEDTVQGVKVKTCVESSESQSTSNESSENQDWDNVTLACFIQNKSKKKLSKCTKTLSQASLSPRTTVVFKEADNQIPSGEQVGLSQSFDTTDGTKDLFVQQNVGSDRRVGKPEDANTLTGDEDDPPLVSLMGNKPKKRSQAAKGRGAFSSSKLKKGSALPCDEHCANKPIIIISDDGGPSMSKHVEEETVLHGGVAEHTNNMEEKDEILSSFLQNRTQRQRKRPSRYS
ncbi:uncharacterized protein LOC113866986 isoform X2 [Abrus precatorius]|uniref:Uncharacterized protein LOC113866986 isoform X2 n=1 Tax=Abrus precatorius TaxID=3816 RepID=A0A8B8LQF2_ABRPR|nr:uncharacterized protein LOC113866986 isoform X2 [Abrus precatorius]